MSGTADPVALPGTDDPGTGGAPSTPAISCVGLHKAFDGVPAVAGVDLEAPRGALTAVLGPSGCGKTTLLRLVAGFERPDAGTVRVADRVVADDRTFVGPDRRRIGMVFQDYALFPHLDVAANVAYGLGRRPDRARVAELLDLVGLGDLGARRPHELSGGQQQRVALARALAPRPDVVLLDEPFSNLDARLRGQLRRDMRDVLAAAGTSAVLVTHDQDEALSLADHVVLMRSGTVEQVGTPEAIYRRPATRWAAEFVGTVDVLPGVADGGRIETPLGTVADPGVHRGAVEVALRPEDVALTTDDETGDGRPVVVVAREYYGRDQLVTVELADGRRVRHRGPGFPPWAPGDRGHIHVTGSVSVVGTGPRAPR
ncbi:MAG: ABC transporter ATP-binding protein [Solirubrobacteraceae bacterium]